MPNDMNCELPSSALEASSSSLVMLALPNCSTVTPGGACATVAVAVEDRLDLLDGGVGITGDVELDEHGAAVLGGQRLVTLATFC